MPVRELKPYRRKPAKRFDSALEGQGMPASQSEDEMGLIPGNLNSRKLFKQVDEEPYKTAPKRKLR